MVEKKKTIIDIPFKSNGNSTRPTKKKQEVTSSTIETATEQSEPNSKSTEPAREETPAQEKIADETAQAKTEEFTVTPEDVGNMEPTTEDEPSTQPENESIKTVNLEPKKVSTPSALSFADNISIVEPKTEQQNVTSLEEITPENRPKESFTIEAFQEKWIIYKKSLEKDGKSSLASVFDNLPQIEENTIKVMVENKVLMEEFQEHLSDFLSYIRQELNNYALMVEMEINQGITRRKAYTPQEKYVKMAEKNPSLKVLAKKLDMDVGYA